MALFIDDRIFQLQTHGGISQIWKQLAPHLQAIQTDEPIPDIFMSSYYGLSPSGIDSVVLAYDFIAEHYHAVGAYHVDAVQKREAIAEAKAVIAISQWTANDVKNICGKEASVAYCGTNLERAEPAEVQAFKAKYRIDKPYVLTVGRRDLYKNVQALYQAWQFFYAQRDCMVLCIGGESATVADGNFQNQYPAQWKRVYIEDHELASAYTGATMLVYPSFYEGFGLPVLEAMACGCPIVCGQQGAVPEFALDSPYYCSVYRPLDIARAMNEALQADYQRHALAMTRAKAYTWERMAQRIVQIIKELPSNE